MVWDFIQALLTIYHPGYVYWKTITGKETWHGITGGLILTLYCPDYID